MNDVFSIGDSNRNTNVGFVAKSFDGTRSRDRGTRVEWIQSLALHRLAAKATVALTGLRKCPCLALVLGSHDRRSHRGRGAGTA
jgi:hypothetical protein